jgi:hypothetical protein
VGNEGATADHDAVLASVIQKASSLQPGTGAGQVGPVIDALSQTKILSYVNNAVEKDGATVLVDGRIWAATGGAGNACIHVHKFITSLYLNFFYFFCPEGGGKFEEEQHICIGLLLFFLGNFWGDTLVIFCRRCNQKIFILDERCIYVLFSPSSLWLCDPAAPAGCVSGGAWVGPTVIMHQSAKDAACREEIFGPVLSVVRVRSWEEAMAIENSNPFGNAACIYTTVRESNASL